MNIQHGAISRNPPNANSSFRDCQGPSFTIDFSWRKFKSLIYEGDTVGGTPLYALIYNILGHLKLVFKRVSNPAALDKITSEETSNIQEDNLDANTGDSDIVGKGKIRNVRIDADYEVHGRSDKLVAQNRWRTKYTHRSKAMSNDGNFVTMYWLSDSDFKTWDFICVDENQLPVAKLTANLWALKKLGKIEFMGPKAHDRAFQEEIMVAGTTLAYTMIMRVNNPLSLLGSASAKPGHDKDWSEEASNGANGKYAVV